MKIYLSSLSLSVIFKLRFHMIGLRLPHLKSQFIDLSLSSLKLDFKWLDRNFRNWNLDSYPSVCSWYDLYHAEKLYTLLNTNAHDCILELRFHIIGLRLPHLKSWFIDISLFLIKFLVIWLECNFCTWIENTFELIILVCNLWIEISLDWTAPSALEIFIHWCHFIAIQLDFTYLFQNCFHIIEPIALHLKTISIGNHYPCL